CIIFFGNSEPYITNISGDKNQVNLAANNAVLHTVQNNSPDIHKSTPCKILLSLFWRWRCLQTAFRRKIRLARL
ncbi:hypothetical protein, partial [Treponema endosymbiont of Eucomonympha sp.]|uniref:hypothetical protein n=1 Tax=Treponema endosymbiont of Eucomonympha sp. TaxID=1580831 RepID=UPI001EE6DD51